MAHRIVESKFTTVDEALAFITTSNFFIEAIEIVNPKEYKFSPDLKKDTQITWPLFIEYIDSPNIANLEIPFSEIKLKHEWDIKENNLLKGYIVGYYNNFTIIELNISVHFYEENLKIYSCIECNWINKPFFIPDGIQNSFIDAFEDIFNKINNNKK